MRICSPQLGLAPKSILGGEVFDREILLGLAKSGVNIEVILPKNKPHDQNIRNWHITYLPISRFPAIFGNILIIPSLYSVYRQRKFDILRIHQPQLLGLGALIFKIFHRHVKLVATYHQFRETSFWFLSKSLNNFWDHIICDSEHVKKRLIKTYQIASRKITVVHNGVPSYLKPSVKDENLAKKLKIQSKIILLFTGLFDRRKNPLFLLEVLSNLTKSRSDIILIFWGKGPLESQIKNRAKELGIEDNIRIQKPIFGKEKNKIHNLADIFVHPSVDEGFALSPLEAMACAKPIVMTRGYSASEAVENGVNGFLCRANDLDQWRDKIIELINDTKLRIIMGQESRKRAEREFQWKFAVAKHTEVFKKITG